MSGIDHRLGVAALITFINTVYARPWQQDQQALLLPGIVGGLVGYTIGARIRQAKRCYWLAMAVGALASVGASFLYNEILLTMPEKPEWYEVYVYGTFLLMNVAAFSVFGLIGWPHGAEDGKNED